MSLISFLLTWIDRSRLRHSLLQLDARLLADATLDAPISAVVTSISATATPRTVEARLRLPALHGWRPGMTGRASVTLRNSNLWGALWWSVRRGIRSDILL